ncbi:MAG TPA: hypothetical protein VH496_08205 [Mycobacterium sp.]|jgi:hypothetical protein
MSKPSTRKKARRQKRLAQKVVWARITDALDELDELDEEPVELPPGNVTETILGVGGTLADGYPELVAELVGEAQRFEHRILARGWTFDTEYSSDDGFACWFFAPSGAELEDEALETVTRVWMTPTEIDLRDERDFPNAVHVVLVGSGERSRTHQLSPDRFFEQLETIEAYRVGAPALTID